MKKIVRYLIRHPLQISIAMGVLGVHFFIFYYTYDHKSFFPVRVKPKPLIVRTRIYQPPPPPPAPKKIVKKVTQKKRKGKVALKKKPKVAKIPLKVPPPIKNLKVDTDASKESVAKYRENLVAFLQNELKLPEIGSVTLKLSLQANGKVLKVIILSSESENNKAYLEGLLPELKFPIFGKELGQKKNHIFTLTFCNES